MQEENKNNLRKRRICWAYKTPQSKEYLRINMEYDFVLIKDKVFYDVTEDEIIASENEMNLLFPRELKVFWSKIGYGFLSSKKGNINRIMDPVSVRDFRAKEGDFEYIPDVDIYEIYEKDKLIFFEANESAYISIGIDPDNNGKIYYYDVEIAENLSDFLLKLISDDNYYVDMKL